jgi:2-polyprenyl-3-methyl-5-hydroxy-6-metoxy-1,4-benzoquinol methylase
VEFLYRALTHRNFRRMGECATLTRWLDPRPGERILDVGCGDGFYDHRIARRGAAVVGIDIDDSRLATARRRNTTERTEFLHMNAEDMEFPDESFDKVVSFCVIEHFRDDDQVLKHVGRVLKPGGRLFLSADSLSNPEIREEERVAHRHRYAVNTFYTVEILRRKLRAAGMEPVRWHYILTTPVTLAMVRWTWAVDDLPAALVPLKVVIHAVLTTGGRLVSDLAEVTAGRARSGLTLLAEARKP